MLLSVGFLLIMSLTQDIVLTGDQCILSKQTFTLVQDRNGSNVCAQVLSTALVSTVQSKSECGLSCMKAIPCASYTLFEDTMRCVIYSYNPPPYFEQFVPHCWSYVDDKFTPAYDCVATSTRSLFVFADEIINEFYIDGVNQVPSGGWPSVSVVGPIVIPINIRVIAMKITNIGGDAGLLASSTDGFLLSNSSVCKCKTSVTHPTTWMMYDDSFDDSGWDMCVNTFPNDASQQSSITEQSSISTNAWWIWKTFNTPAQPPADNVVYFRWNIFTKCTPKST